MRTLKIERIIHKAIKRNTQHIDSKMQSQGLGYMIKFTKTRQDTEMSKTKTRQRHQKLLRMLITHKIKTLKATKIEKYKLRV